MNTITRQGQTMTMRLVPPCLWTIGEYDGIYQKLVKILNAAILLLAIIIVVTQHNTEHFQSINLKQWSMQEDFMLYDDAERKSAELNRF